MNIETFVQKYGDDSPEFREDLLKLLESENQDFSRSVIESFDKKCHKMAMRIMVGAAIITVIIIVLFLIFK